MGNRRLRLIAALSTTLVLVTTGGITATTAVAAPPACDTRVNNTTAKLLECVDLAGVREHQAAFQAIADANGGTRVSGSPGYDESVDYVVEKLDAAGWQTTVQPFQFQTFITLSPTVLERVSPPPAGPVETTIFSYAGSGDITAAVSLPADAGSGNEGCEAADFAGFPAGNIALVQRGTCSFAIKATNAYDAGASAVIIWNNTAGTINGTLGNGFTLDIPVAAVTQAVGAELAATPGLIMRREDRDLPWHRDDLQRARRTAGQEHRQRRDGRGAPRLGQRRTGHQRQRERVGSAHRGRREPRQGQAAEHRAVRVVGCGGVRPRRIDLLRRQPGAERARQDRAVPQLRHDREPEPRLLHL